MLALGPLMRGPAHGYRLFAAYQQEFGEIWTAGRSRFDAGLRDLPRRRPARRTNRIAATGGKQFLAWKHRRVTPLRAVRVVFLTKLRFSLFELLRLPRTHAPLSAQQAACREGLAHLVGRAARAAKSESTRFEEILDTLRVHQARSVLNWLEWLAKTSRTGKGRIRSTDQGCALKKGRS